VKIGDLVIKRWGRIDPEDNGVIGIIVKKPSRYGGNPDFVKVWLPHGERLWRMSDMELISEENYNCNSTLQSGLCWLQSRYASDCTQ